jgi:hemerythrin-like domain-containing protein
MRLAAPPVPPPNVMTARRGARRKEMAMNPTETLKHEHQIVLLILDAAEREAGSIRAGGEVHAGQVQEMLDFFKNFVDRCHHGKEERHLFPRLEQRGLPSGAGPVAVMLHEHEQGRAAVRAIAAALAGVKAGDREAAGALAAGLTEYAVLLRSHISKENEVLFPMADRMLSDGDQAELAEAFDKVEAEEIGPGVHERYHRLAHELAGH